MANDYASPRVVVRERRSGTPQIRGVPTNLGALVIRCLRGPVGKAIRITSWPQFVRIFGGFDPNSYGPDSVKAFFDNGGSTLYVIRQLGSSGGANVKASRTLATPAASSGSITGTGGPWVLAHGDTFTASIDGVAAGTKTINATRASKTGAAASYAAGAAGDNVVISVTNVLGGANQMIDLSAAAATQAGYLQAINEQLVGGRAVNSGGQIKVETDQLGSGAGGSIVSLGGAAAAKTGLSVGAFTNAGPNNVANVAAVTPAELGAILNYAGTTPTAGVTSLTLSSSTTGATSIVQFTGGTGVSKIAGFDLAPHAGSASAAQNVMVVTAKGEGFDSNGFAVLVGNSDTKIATAIPATVNAGNITEMTLSSAIIARLSVGDTIKFSDTTTGTVARGIVKQIANNKVVFASNITLSGNLTAANTSVTLETFSFGVQYGGGNVQGPVSGLRMSPLSAKNYFAKVLNVDDDELLVSVTDSGAAATNLDLRPQNTVVGVADPLTGGSEATTFADADWIGSPVNKTGLYALDKRKDVRLVAIPGVTGNTAGAVTKALVQYCENRADCVAIVAPPANTTAANAKAFKADNVGSSSYGAMYYPYVQIVGNLSGVKETVPPEGFVMGMIAKADREQGIAKAPAGEFTGRLVGTVGVERIVEDEDKDLLYPSNINCIEDLPDVGQCVMGARTMEDGDFNSLHIRRTFIYLEQSLKTGMRWVLFEPNTEGTRSRAERTVSSFLETEWKRNTLDGETIDEAFTVICDGSNNPQSVVKQRLMVLDAEVNVPETTENLLINISQKTSGASLAA